ncbi:MAG TPA: gamma-glutamyl-gamma-aminobutyrate hydrolase family protein [Chitinophagaceae bacterium]|jgi:putative glutamine amidotransferase|nr:gamma-glutamyl-gamma-aminobutyrate hydrolase family protein [Chitinophagaceae bacterium]
MKQKIGISYTQTNFQHYLDWFKPDAAEVELVTLSFEAPDEALFGDCAGFILTGGVDIDPAFYGGPAGYPHAPDRYCPERDGFEAGIYRYALAHGRPVLGICRGFQLVNVLEGGGLIQDLGPVNAVHRKEALDKEHTVQLEPGSLLAELAGSAEGSVNSAHHQAVDDAVLSPRLQAAARAGGIIEGFEWKDKTGKPFLLGVQWHPERMRDRNENPLSHRIRERFLSAIKSTEHENY